MCRFYPFEQYVGDTHGPDVGTRVADGHPATWREDPRHLAKRARRVRIVMERVRAQDRCVRRIREGKRLGVRLQERDVVDRASELPGFPEHLGGQVDAHDRSGDRGRAPRRCARPASDVQQPVLRGELERLERPVLDRVAPARREPTFVGTGATVEPMAGGSLLVLHIDDGTSGSEAVSRSRARAVRRRALSTRLHPRRGRPI